MDKKTPLSDVDKKRSLSDETTHNIGHTAEIVLHLLQDYI